MQTWKIGVLELKQRSWTPETSELDLMNVNELLCLDLKQSKDHIKINKEIYTNLRVELLTHGRFFTSSCSIYISFQ